MHGTTNIKFMEINVGTSVCVCVCVCVCVYFEQLNSRAVYMHLFVCKLWRQLIIIFVTVFLTCVGRDCSVGIASSYGLDGPGIESRWWRDFPHRPDRPCGPPRRLCSGYRVLPGDEAAVSWRWPPTQSSAEVKERVDLYLYSSGPLWPVQGWTFLSYWGCYSWETQAWMVG